VLPAAADEVSTGIAQLFSAHAANYHATAAQAAAFNDQFVQNLTAGAHSYASAEAVNVSFLLWLVQNAGFYEAIQYLWGTLSINYPFLQLLDYVLAPIQLALGVGLLLLFFAAIWVLPMLAGSLGQSGL
jgi:hypothetical protein